jgi:hypothetical protein
MPRKPKDYHHFTDGVLGRFYFDAKERLHRTSGPALEYKNGGRYWYKHGLIHRIDGPAIECSDGDKEWWVNGKLHRTDGPAIECSDGDKLWWVDGNLHRTDGPAIEYRDENKEWWVDGVELTEDEFNRRYPPKPILLPKVKSRNVF